MIFLEEQLEIIRRTQEWMGPLSEGEVLFFRFFETQLYSNMVLAFVWLVISWRWGARLGALLVIGKFCSGSAKLLFAMERPGFYDSMVSFYEPVSYGFPSGAATKAVVMAFLLIYGWKSRWAVPTAILYVFLMSAFRIILGVHFVVDLIGGWILGAALSCLFFYGVERVERFASKQGDILMIAILAGALFGLIVLPAKVHFSLIYGAALSIGVYLSTKWGLYLSSKGRSLNSRIWQGLFASFGVVILYFLPLLFENLYSRNSMIALVSLWISLVASPICKRVWHRTLRQR